MLSEVRVLGPVIGAHSHFFISKGTLSESQYLILNVVLRGLYR